jgi:hypothetical protein
VGGAGEAQGRRGGQDGDATCVAWDQRIVPALTDYIGVPSKSPMFDADWSANGLIERVVRDAAMWVESRKVPGLQLEVIRLEGRTPVIFFEVPARRPTATDTVLLYGHLDKQPEFNGWRATSAPGRRSTRTACSTAAAAPTTATPSMPRSPRSRPCRPGPAAPALRRPDRDLRGKRQLRPAGLPRRAAAAAGQVGLVVCLDSGAGNYDQLWLTTSLRGMVSGVLKVEVLTEGVHWRRQRPGAQQLPHPAPGARPAGGFRHR